MKKILLHSLFCINILVPAITSGQVNNHAPVRLALAGISHGHSSWILGRNNDAVASLEGIFEKDKALIDKYSRQYNIDRSLFFTSLEEMLDKIKPEAVLAFGSTFDHLEIVKACAPRGIHVMVEKPLATTVQQAEEIFRLAKTNNIHVLTNYETSWYPSTDKTRQLITDSNYIGKITKGVFHHGHEGPKKIRVSEEFFSWLTDSVKNGGGALMDFGCYGANIMSWLMDGEVPVSVTAITQNLQPEIYKNVEDEATIIIRYKNAHAIIQASWNWPFNRKDMDIYGSGGMISANNSKEMVLKKSNRAAMQITVEKEETGTFTDPFIYFADVVRNKIQPAPYSLYSIENNLMVVRILELAKISALTGKTELWRWKD